MSMIPYFVCRVKFEFGHHNLSQKACCIIFHFAESHLINYLSYFPLAEIKCLYRTLYSSKSKFGIVVHLERINFSTNALVSAIGVLIRSENEHGGRQTRF